MLSGIAEELLQECHAIAQRKSARLDVEAKVCTLLDIVLWWGAYQLKDKEQFVVDAQLNVNKDFKFFEVLRLNIELRMTILFIYFL